MNFFKLKTILFIALFIPIAIGTFSCAAQQANDPLLSKTMEKTGLFIEKRPIYFNLQVTDTLSFQLTLKKQKVHVSDEVLADLILNARKADTASWKQTDLPGKILVNARKEHIDLSRVKNDLQLTDKKQIRNHKKILKMYNHAKQGRKIIFSLSKAVYTNDRQYAIITRYRDCGGPQCGNGIIDLYHYENNAWVNIGYVQVWTN